MQELLKQEGFFRKLFDALPVMALIASRRGEVLAVNEVTKNLTGGLPLPETKRGGDVLHCLHTKDDPRGCGFGPYCDTCKIRATALEAIAGQTVKRVKGYLDIEIDGSAERLSLLISASPLEYKGEKLAVVILEDVSQITVLSGILQACAYCRNIRNEHGVWQDIESYVREHSEAEFSHGICPNCIREHHLDYLKNINKDNKNGD